MLNRINPADTNRNIFMDGTINGLVGAAAPVQGGSIYFYSPGGFVLGSNAIVNVGSLVLSALPITVDGSGNFINGTTVQFGAAVNPNASVVTNGPFANSIGAQINASNYVAMVAPRVVHNGAITTGGQAALVAGNAATINFSPDGLFDIQINDGTQVADAITVGGSIGGPSGNGPQGDYNRIYMVAIPKNQAMTLAISDGASLGFDIAGAADVVGNAIVLSAGYNVAGGTANTAHPFISGNQSTIAIGAVNATSALTGTASGQASVQVFDGDAANFASDLTLSSTVQSLLTANGVNSDNTGASINVGGNLDLSGTVIAATGTSNAATGGTAWIQALVGGQVNVTGNAAVRADGYGGTSFVTANAGGAGQGGTARIDASSGGDVTIGGSLSVSATGVGGNHRADGTAGAGRGGTIVVQAVGAGSTLDVGGTLTANADGNGGDGQVGGTFGCTLCLGDGGAGTGGSAFVGTGSGASSLTVDGDTTITANGSGGDGDHNGGAGTGGGRISLGTYGATTTFGAGSTIQYNSDLTVTATGSGGDGRTGVGGAGTGGRAVSGAQASATGGQLTVVSDTMLNVSGDGGSAFAGTGAGGSGTGGDSDNYSTAGTVDYQGNVNIYTEGQGGFSTGGTGGAATGGQAWLESGGAVVTVGGDYNISGDAYGGSGLTAGGAAQGGNVYLVASGGDLTVSGAYVSVHSDARGGFGFSGNGGTGTGGNATLRASGSGNLLSLTGESVYINASGRGGSVNTLGTTGGLGQGGTADVRALTDGAIAISGSLSADASGTGGSNEGSDATRGDGRGGQTLVVALTGGDITVDSYTYLYADGNGGYAGECFGCGGPAGDGYGGILRIRATGAGSTVTFNDFVAAQADGFGSESSPLDPLIPGSGIGGDGTGGLTEAYASDSGSLSFTNLTLLAQGYGGPDYTGAAAGNGTGGTARISTFGTGNSTVDIAGSAIIDASGLGGGGSEGPSLAGGDGTGGLALIAATTGTIDIDLGAELTANGRGGSAFNGTGGDGTGGTTSVWTQSGTITIGTSVEDGLRMNAVGSGGDGYNNIGGNALGGFNTVEVNGTGTIGVSGGVRIDGSAAGGDGNTGGNAAARTTPNTNEIQPDAGTIVVRGGGSVTIGGLAELIGDATGGTGSYGTIGGNGGNAVAGELDVNPYVGSITMNGLSLSATARGGNGGAGGNGGNAVGGLFDVLIGVGDPINGILTTGNVSITADAYGGDGGAGLSGLVGGNGGNGGNASMSTDSNNQFSANAAGGTIVAGTVTISHVAYGGDGGAGGDGSSGAGGNGGAGGSAQGSNVQTGSLSNNAAATSGGALTLTDMSLDTSLFGGVGGAGGTGATVGGNGGDGGDAGTVVGGSSFFGVRGVTATVGDLSLYANSTGGNGGAAGNGGVAGNGGDAVSGRIAVESRERFSFPGQRGTLLAGDIYGEAIATAGTGAFDGISRSDGNNSFVLYNGDATIGSFQFVIDANTYSLTAYDFIAIVDGTAQINGGFDFSTTNPLSLYANRGSLTAPAITLDAPTFVPLTGNAVLGIEADPASTPGTFSATSFAITTGGDFYTTANLDSVDLLEIIAPGSITANNITGDNEVYLNAQNGFIQVNDIDAGQEISIYGYLGITANDLTSDEYIDASTSGVLTIHDATSVQSTYLSGSGGINYNTISGNGVQLYSGAGTVTGGNISSESWLYGYADGDLLLGDLDAVGEIQLVAFGNIDIGNAIAGEDLSLETSGYLGDVGGYIASGNLTAGDSIEVEAGTYADLGNLSSGLVNPSIDPFAEYNIGVLAGDYIVAGDIASANHAGLAAPNTITAGNVDVAGIFMALGGGDMSFASISAGQNVYLADFSMMPLGGALGPGNDFDPAPILAVSPVATGGDITVTGAIDGAIVQAAAGGDIATGAITSDTSTRLEAGGGISTGALAAGTSIDFRAGGNIAIGGNATAGTYLDVESFDGGITTQAITTGDNIELSAGGGNVIAGSLSAGLVNPVANGEYHVAAYAANGSVTTGNVSAAGDILLLADTTITGGTMDAGNRMLALAGGNIALSNITTSGLGQVQIGDISMIALGGTPGDNFNVDALFVPLPTRSGGSVTLATVSTGLLQIGAGGNLTTGLLVAADAAWLSSGGNILVNGDVFAGDTITMLATGSITARDLYADTGVLVNGGGAVTLRDIYAGSATGVGAQEGTEVPKNIGVGAPVEVFSNTSITIDDILTDGYVGLYSAGALTVDTIGAGHDIIALAGTDASFGAITTPETFTLAGYGNFASLFSGQTFTPALMFGIANPASTGGDATFNGAVSTSAFESYVGDATSLQGITAGSILARSGGLLTVNAPLNSSLITLISGDIDIGANGRINGGATGQVTLRALSDLLVGDGLTGTGYALSNAEFGRINGDLIRITSGGFAGVDADTLVGDLTVTFGPNGNIRSSGGGFEIVTLSEAGNELDGTLRVVGDVLASGLGVDNYVGFYTQNFELDAATGTIALTDAQGALGGTLELWANRIHVADGTLLDQLAANPQFDGYVEALNAPAAVQRPDGVIRAANFEIEFIDVGSTEPFSLLVQNTGTADLPAGFVLTNADIGDGESTLPPGAVNLVINGQIVTPTGTVTGIAVRDLLVSEFGTEAFLPQSTINGCLLTGSCEGGGPIDDLPPAVNLTPPIIELVGGDPLGEPPFGNEPDIDDSLPGDIEDLSSPITPPQPLFDTTPLDPTGDINDPVSGAGNPSLYSLHSDDDDEDEDNKKKKPTDKGGKK